ncbi:MAG TPA: hypothetical protein VFF30_16795 [Nitrososphaerales archaeon]|nr:hypothetical protein [Nitrososphaerales archaeon]
MTMIPEKSQFSDGSIKGIVAYVPAKTELLIQRISSLNVKFACFLYEDDVATRHSRNQFLADFIHNNLDAFVDQVPLPLNPSESFEWLYNKVNWEVDYFLEKYPESKSSDLLFLVSQDQVPIIVTLYTVALQRNTKFAYIAQSFGFSPVLLESQLGFLPSLFRGKGEPHRSLAFQKYREEYYAAAASDFARAWDQAGDKCMQALHMLSTCYDHVDRFSYRRALEELRRLRQDENCFAKLCDMAGSGSSQQIQKLADFLQIADEHFGVDVSRNEVEVFSNTKAVEVFIRSLYVSAMRRIKQHEAEQAALLLYRIVEVVAQSFLAKRGIDTAKFDMMILNESSRTNFVNLMRRLNGDDSKDVVTALERSRLGAFDCWALFLSCFYDGNNLEPMSDEEKLKFLGHLRKRIDLRNRCFLEHGVKGVSVEQAEDFSEWVKNAVVKRFLSLSLKTASEDESLRPLSLSAN